MKVVISDVTSVLHLIESRALPLLQRAGEVLAPPAVEKELANSIPGWSVERPTWLQVATLPSGAARQAEQLYGVGGLGFGEAQAIALAREIRADWLLTDDAGVRVVAVALGLEVHGSLGVILRAAAAGNIRRGEAVSALNGLAKSSLWISSDLLREAREALDRLLPP